MSSNGCRAARRMTRAEFVGRATESEHRRRAIEADTPILVRYFGRSHPGAYRGVPIIISPVSSRDDRMRAACLASGDVRHSSQRKVSFADEQDALVGASSIPEATSSYATLAEFFGPRIQN